MRVLQLIFIEGKLNFKMYIIFGGTRWKQVFVLTLLDLSTQASEPPRTNQTKVFHQKK